MTRYQLIEALGFWREKPWDRHPYSTQDLADWLAYRIKSDRDERSYWADFYPWDEEP